MKYDIVLRVEGISNFHTVMTAVEGTHGIEIVKAGLATELPTKVKKPQRHYVHPDGSMYELFVKAMDGVAKGNNINLTRLQIGSWLTRQGFSGQSWGALVSNLLKAGKLSKRVEGGYMYLPTKVTKE